MSNTPTGAPEIIDQAWRKDALKGSAYELTYAGTLSYARRRYSRDLQGVDIAVSGIPFDSAVTNRPGCRLGPRAVRAASTQLAELNSFPFGFDPFDTLAVVDYGDCALNAHAPMTVPDDIAAHAREILATDTAMLTFGGDHFVAYPLIKAHAEKHGPVALLQFDAHCDTWESSGPLDHGTMFLSAVNEGLFDVDHSIQVGLRTHNDIDVGIEVLTAPWVHRYGVDATLEAIRKRVGDRPVYLSFDIDVLDPAFAPGTGTPVSGGLASWQALELIRGLGSLNMVAMDLVEVSPPYDHAEITALAAATVAYDWLCVMAQRRQQGLW
ncbi:MAG: agmatinase [Geminicoccus sp.]|nr:agmatinase [Geminicoccus sp.]